MCSRCHKRVAVVFVTKLENGTKINEGLCMKCAKDLGVPIDNMLGDVMSQLGLSPEQMEAMEAEMNRPVNTPIVTKPVSDKQMPEKKGRAADAYKAAMLDALRSGFKRVSNVLQAGVDTDGGSLVPEEYEK